MQTVAEARAQIVAAFSPLSVEQIGLNDALGRVLAEDVASRLTQPFADVSAMDGYAVRAKPPASSPAHRSPKGPTPSSSRRTRKPARAA